MPINQIVNISGSLVLPRLIVTQTGVRIVDTAIDIQWEKLGEFVEMLAVAKRTAILLGFIREEEKTDGKNGCPS